MVPTPFFTNFTLHPYYDKKTKTKQKKKQAKKQCSWELTGQLLISHIKGTINLKSTHLQ